jgi:hypothetical protein
MELLVKAVLEETELTQLFTAQAAAEVREQLVEMEPVLMAELEEMACLHTLLSAQLLTLGKMFLELGGTQVAVAEEFKVERRDWAEMVEEALA